MDIFSLIGIYWFQILAVFIFFIIIWYYKTQMKEDEQRDYQKWFPTIIVILAWIVFTPFFQGPVMNWVMYTIVWLTIFFNFGFIYQEKYLNEGQVIADGASGSWCTSPREVGPFTIFNVGTSNKTFTIDTGDFIIIAPTIFIDWEGPKAYVNCQLTKRELGRLPVPLQIFLRSNEKKYNIYDIRFGMFSREQLNSRRKLKISRQESEVVLLKDFEEKFLNSEKEKGVLQEHVQGITESFEKQGQHIDILGKFGKTKRRLPFISEPQQDKDEVPN